MLEILVGRIGLLELVAERLDFGGVHAALLARCLGFGIELLDRVLQMTRLSGKRIGNLEDLAGAHQRIVAEMIDFGKVG